MGQTGKRSSFGLILILVFLAVGAAVAAYFLHFRTDDDDAREIAAHRPHTPPREIANQYVGQLTDEERRQLSVAALSSEFANPFGASRTTSTPPPLPAATPPPVLPQPKTGVYTEDLRTKFESGSPPSRPSEPDKAPIPPTPTAGLEKKPAAPAGPVPIEESLAKESVPAPPTKESQTTKADVKPPAPATPLTPEPAPAAKPVPEPAPAAKPVPEPTSAAKPVPEPTPAAKPVPEPTPAAKPAPEPTSAAKPVPEPTSAAKPVPEPTSAPPADAAPPLTPPPPGSSGPLEAAALETDTRDKNKKGIWAINALSTEDNQQARDALNKLMGLPHRVYVYRTEVKGVTYYRIRVGFFKNYEDAAKVGNLLASKYQFPKPWIVMPGPEELAKYHP